jgi:hypothetical protein
LIFAAHLIEESQRTPVKPLGFHVPALSPVEETKVVEGCGHRGIGEEVEELLRLGACVNTTRSIDDPSPREGIGCSERESGLRHYPAGRDRPGRNLLIVIPPTVEIRARLYNSGSISGAALIKTSTLSVAPSQKQSPEPGEVLIVDVIEVVGLFLRSLAPHGGGA